MADPHIQSPMDFWDYVTVIVYRSGFVIAGMGLLIFPYFAPLAQHLLLVSGVMLASSLHLYLKSYRLGFQFVLWIGLLCQIWGAEYLGLGSVLLVLGGLCYKEYFCFRILGLQFQPILLALIWFSAVFDLSVLVIGLSAVSGLLTLFLAFQKWRMPLHFDIGDKTKYQL